MENSDPPIYQKKLDELLKFIDNELVVDKKITENKMFKVKGKITESFLLIANLYGKIESLEKELEKERQSPRTMTNMTYPTYATATKGGGSQVRTNIEMRKPQGATILITPKEGENLKATERKLMETLKPKQDKLKIRNIKTTKSAIIIETETKEDTDKILTNEKLTKIMNVERPRKKEPKIILYDIPHKMTDKEIHETIFEQNFEGSISKEEYNKGFKLRFKTGPRDRETVHHVAETTPKIRMEILKKRRIYLNFTAITAKDFLAIPRCLKCQDLGHVAKHCNSEETNCSHCGGNGHEKKTCPKKEEQQKCIPCSKKGKKCNKVGKDYRECETYKMLVEREREKTNYEL